MVVALSSARDEGHLKRPNGPPSVRVTTPPAVADVPPKNLARVPVLCGRACQGAMTRREERLAWPGRREMKPETSDAPHDTACDFEQVQTDRADGRRRPSRAGEDRAPEVREQQQREAVQLQPKGIRAEAMTAEAIRVDVELELLDPILRRAAVVVPRDEIGGTAPAIGDHEADVETRRGDVDLDENPPMMGPRLSAMPETRAEVNGTSTPLIPGLGLRDHWRHARLEDTIGADPEHVIDAFGFQLGFDRRCGHPCIAPQEDRRVRKAPAQRRQDVAELVDDSRRTRIPPGTQPGPQQEAGASFEPDQRVIHVLVVPAMKERELLRPVRGIVRAIEIEDEIGGVFVGAVGVAQNQSTPVRARR
jgi:hypothetical protein